MDFQPVERNNHASGWSIQSRTDEQGRTLYSIYIGERLVVRDALSSDGAVIAARKWVQSRQDSGRGETNGAGQGAGTTRTRGAAR